MTAWFAPGRIEVLGKHTDYAGGRSLLMAVEQGVTVTVRDAPSGITARSSAYEAPVDLEETLPDGHWGRYLATAARRLERNFGPLRPCTLEVESTLPLASGMSSSSALVVAGALALAEHQGFDQDPRWRATLDTPEALATYLACVENGSAFRNLPGDDGVGTHGGSEDHTAMVCGKSGQLLQARFGGEVPVVERLVTLPDGYVMVVAVSGVLAEKTGAAREQYNRASRLAREVVAAWNDASGRTDSTIGGAADSSPDAGDQLAEVTQADPELSDRLRHFLAESQHVVAGADALAAGDVDRFGAVAVASQRDAETLLGNQIPETVRLAAAAVRLGAIGASAFGAGYGGSVWALVRADDAERFSAAWLDDYRAAFPEHDPSVILARPSDGIRRLS